MYTTPHPHALSKEKKYSSGNSACDLQIQLPPLAMAVPALPESLVAVASWGAACTRVSQKWQQHRQWQKTTRSNRVHYSSPCNITVPTTPVANTLKLNQPISSRGTHHPSPPTPPHSHSIPQPWWCLRSKMTPDTVKTPTMLVTQLVMPFIAAMLVITVTLGAARPPQLQRHKQSQRGHPGHHWQKWRGVKVLGLKYSWST